MDYPLFSSIKTKILLWLAIVALPIACTGVFSLWFIYTKLSERIDLDLLNASRLEAARIQDSLDNYQLSVESLVSNRLISGFSADETVAGHIESAIAMRGVQSLEPGLTESASWSLDALSERLLQSAALTDSEITAVKLVAADLSTMGSTAGFSWEPYNPYLVKASIDERSTLFGNGFIGIDGVAQLGVVTPIFAKSGLVVGAAMFEMRLGPVVDLVVEHEGFGETSEAHIAQPTPEGDAEFITLMRFARDAAFNKVVPVSRDLPINWSLQSPDRHIVRSPDYRSVPSILALQTISETGWGLVVKIDESEAMQPVVEIQRIALFAFLITVLFICLFFFVHLVPLTRRLGTMAIAVERIAGGDYSTRIADSSHDEIGVVGRSFDRMSAALKEETNRRIGVEKEIRYQATHDALTDLHNRGAIAELLGQLDKLADKKTHTVFFIDLNGFKPINDNHGHAVGDSVLCEVASRLRQSIGDKGVVGRWGGDEFVVVLPNTTVSQSQGLQFRIEAQFNRGIECDGLVLQAGCSIGVASNEYGASLSRVLEQADSNMYTNKMQLNSRENSRAA